jgi:AsmA family protein
MHGPAPSPVPSGRTHWLRWIWISLVAALALILFLLVLVAVLPLSWSKGFIEQRLSAATDRAVTIGNISRDGGSLFMPIIKIERLAVANPDWAGSGSVLQVSEAKLLLPLKPLLRGQFSPQTLDVRGMRLSIIRTASGKTNVPSGRGDDNGAPTLQSIAIHDSFVSVRDNKRQLQATGSVIADPARGLLLTLRGTLRGRPASIALKGGAVSGVDPNAPYPFALNVDAAPLFFAARGKMKGILRAGELSAQVEARGDTLKQLDDVIEAGLFGTQPFALKARIERSRPEWRIGQLSGRIGRSNLTGRALVTKQDGRAKITGDVRFSTLDFDDLASDAGLARGRARRAAIGPRIFPETRINLSKIGPTDGVIDIRADRLLFAKPSVFRSVSGRLTLDGKKLSFTQALAIMQSGIVRGEVRVDHRQGQPKLTLDLRIVGATLEQIIGRPSDISGFLRGRVLLTGRGDTIRSALANADGRASLVSANGRMRAILATVLGQDLGKTIGQAIGGGKEMVAMPCLVAAFDARQGRLSPDPLAISTGIGAARGAGQINLANETIALTVSGSTRDPSGLRILDPIRVGGSLTAPSIMVAGSPPSQKPSVGKILSLVGKAIGASFRPSARPALVPAITCGPLMAKALR